MRYLLILLVCPLFVFAQQRTKQKLFSRYGEVELCLNDYANQYCFLNRQADLIINPVNGDFALSVPAERFELDTATYDSVPARALVDLRQLEDFQFAGSIIMGTKELNLEQSGEYRIKMNGEVSQGDTIFNAALNARLIITNAAQELKAELIFEPADFDLNWFEQYGLDPQRMKLRLFFQLRTR